LKAQVIINQKNGEILCTAYGKGREHDFKLYKRSKIKIRKEVRCLADKGYQGIQKYHYLSQTPKKKLRKYTFSPLDKKVNKKLAQERVGIENVFAHLKRFRILQGRDHNRRKRFGLRFNLIAAIYNARTLSLFKSIFKLTFARGLLSTSRRFKHW
jgi:hypothetical protein